MVKKTEKSGEASLKRSYGAQKRIHTDGEYEKRWKTRTRIKRICQQCDIIYYPTNRTNNLLYCSRGCYAAWQSANMKGKKAHGYRGALASYSALHHWVSREKGKPSYCEKCETTEGNFEWANVDGKYNRAVEDWIRMCVKCHRRYDKALREKHGEKSFFNKIFQKNGQVA